MRPNGPELYEVSINAVLFFFSSRRRHTRFDCDWSSDVCSSDLNEKAIEKAEDRLKFKDAMTGIGLASAKSRSEEHTSHSQISYAVFCLKKKKRTDDWTPFTVTGRIPSCARTPVPPRRLVRRPAR